MREVNPVSIPKWPFFLGDAVLLGLAWFIYHESHLPLGHWEMAGCAICAALGALLGVLPFILDYRALCKALEAAALGTASEKIQNLERLAAQISSATNHWENAQLQAEKISGSARELTDRMTSEVRDFSEFMQKMNDGEKSTLRLEVDKLRRAETDWVQVTVHLLDHVYALHNGAMRSGQPRLVDQLTQFQNACRDAARRVGLLAFAPTAGEKFDNQRHQSNKADQAPTGDAVIGETLAPGFTLQGRIIRPALVRVGANGAAEPAPAKPPVPVAEQNQLPLDVSNPA